MVRTKVAKVTNKAMISNKLETGFLKISNSCSPDYKVVFS